jgi:predicted Zn-dependent protease
MVGEQEYVSRGRNAAERIFVRHPNKQQMWSSDFELPTGQLFGDWLYSEIEAEAFFEQDGFMPDQVRRAASRLQQHRPLQHRYVVHVPWLDAINAFTAPGRHIYFGRRLLERCPHEDSVAFVIAHEIAHHDLFHLAAFDGPFARRAGRLQAGLLVVLFYRYLQKRIYSPERELDADRHALDLCVAAGYDLGKCIYLFHVMELIALDRGDPDAVFGLDSESDEELASSASAMTRARIWLYQRQRGYLPIQDRAAELQRYATAKLGHTVLPRGA